MPNTETQAPDAHAPLRTDFLRSIIGWLVIGVVLLRSLAALILVVARWIDPPTTAVHIQGRLQAWVHHKPYRERYKFIPLNPISADLQHAVIPAEDAHSGRFAVPPKELQTIRSRLPLSKPQISPLITDSHGPSSSHRCIGGELMPVCSWADEPLMSKNFDLVAQIQSVNTVEVCGSSPH